MYIQRLLAINMATFAALGTVLLALGEQNPMLAVVAVLAAMAAVWITDILAVFRLNRRVTNLAVLLAVLRSLWELFQIHEAVHVTGIANLLAYVMIILLFQEKDFRTWWHIALLSLLQVAASATFFQGVWFAPLLLVYFFVGLSAVALLFLHHERTHYHQVRHHPIVPRDTRTMSERLGVNWRRLGKIVLATFVVGPVSLFLDYGEPDDKRLVRRRARRKERGSRRWPLIHDEPEFTGSADSLGGRAGIGLEFYRHLAGLIPGTLVVAILLFLLVPRMGRFEFGLRNWRWNSAARGSSAIRATGFSDTVQLGEEGNLTEDPEEIMRVRFLRADSDQVHPMQGIIYLRGAVLDRYNWGVFKGDRTRGEQSEAAIRPERDLPSGLVRQRITIQPLDRRELFCVWPFVVIQRDPRVTIDYSTDRLLRRNPRREEQTPFDLGTYAVVNGTQVGLTPSPVAVDRDRLLQVPENLPTLIGEAQQWINSSQLGPAQVVERARYLESQFIHSEKYYYSLDAQPREADLDPIEDFVKTMPGGHCEYFATALALMLRSQGIASRVVNGFATSEYDARSGFYRVRQRDAHSWVEAYIPPECLPSERPFGRRDVDWQHGAWLRLDPTPARSAPTGLTALVNNVEGLFERIQDAWSEYVVRMNSATQQEAIYNPLKGVLLRLKDTLIDTHGWSSLWESITGLPRRLRALLADAGWFSWIGATLLFSALGFGYLAYCLARWTLHLVTRLLPQHQVRAGGRSRIAFYRRMETLLARRGLRRRPGQTHREFAIDASSHLANGQGDRTESAAMFVTNAFYKVRFGGQRLDNIYLQTVEQALRDLEKAASGQHHADPKP